MHICLRFLLFQIQVAERIVISFRGNVFEVLTAANKMMSI